MNKWFKLSLPKITIPQETISCKNTPMNFTNIVMGDIEPQEPIEIGEKMGLQFAQAVVWKIQVLQLSLGFECILKEK